MYRRRLAALCFGLLAASCGTSAGGELSKDTRRELTTPAVTQLELLLVASDAALTGVDYTLQLGPFKRSGSLPVDKGPLSLRVGSLQNASGYKLRLVGHRAHGADCAAERSFNILPDQLTQLSVVLACDQPSEGGEHKDDAEDAESVDVNSVVQPDESCPTVTGVSISQLDTAVGTSIALEGFTSSPSPTVWSSRGGSFSDSTATRTTFVCTAAGSQQIQFATARGGCPPTLQSLDVDCNALVSCGNGELEPGEECDDGNQESSDGCTAACLREPFCVVDFACDETGTSAFCVSNVQLRVARKAPCSEVCGTNACSGTTCIATGAPINCPADQECVTEFVGSGGLSARCAPKRQY